jgi:hypothetical protein
MRNASIAEWILCRLTSKERAASMVGDLVEIGTRKGPFWFWLSLAGVALSLTWRRPPAFFAALYAANWTLAEFINTADTMYVRHQPQGFWNHAFGPIIFIASTLWAMLFYAAIRYGASDRTAHVTFVWAGLVTTVIYFWWQPLVLGLCVAAALLVASASTLKSSFRKESLVVLASVAVGSALRFLAVIPVVLYQNFLGRRLHILWGAREVQEHPSLMWVYINSVVLAFLVATSLWSRMHNLLMRSQRLESEFDG